MNRFPRPALFAAVAAVLLASVPLPASATVPATLPPGLNPDLVGQRVLVLGDSITQDGRYVSFLEYYLHRLAPGAACNLISIGLSGETVSGLTETTESSPRPCVLERLERALKAVHPRLVLACYGMNDGIYNPPSPARLAAFIAGLHQLIAEVRASGADLILITPPLFDPLSAAGRTVPLSAPAFGYMHTFVGYDQVLAEFAKAETAMAEPGVTVVDLHTPMVAALAARRAANPRFSFSQDGVHPGDLGHLLMAQVIGRALRLPLPTTTLDAELARVKADPVFELVSERRRLRSEAWMPYIGYAYPGSPPYKSAWVDAEETVAARLLGEIDALTGEKP